MIKYTVLQTLAILNGADSAFSKRATITAWGNNPPKLDIRTWRDEGGQLIPGRGVTLSDTEARRTMAALEDYFKLTGQPL